MVNPSGGARSGPGLRRTRKRALPLGFCVLFVFLTMVVAGYYSLIVHVVGNHDRLDRPQAFQGSKTRNQGSNDQQQQRGGEQLTPPSDIAAHASSKKATFKEWKAFAVELAAQPPADVLQVLRTQDPFGVRTFEKSIQQMESDKQAILSMDDVRQLFPCPTAERITLPDQRDHDKARKYRSDLNVLHPAKANFVFLFFQHLRKAGGTNFCGLAQHNLMKTQVPS